MDTQMEITTFTVGRKCLVISQSHWSSPVLGNKPKKFDFVHQTTLNLCTLFWSPDSQYGTHMLLGVWEKG